MPEPVLLPETTGSSYPTPRQIEDGEAQAGGINGLWNEHAKVAVERTNWLRAQVEALQSSGGYKSALTFTGNQTLTAADAGKCYIYGGTSAVGLTLPLIADTPDGSMFEVINTGTANVIVQRAGSDQIDNGPSAVSQIVIPPYQSLKVIRAAGLSLWHPVGLTAASLATSFNSDLAATGWQQLPSGLIFQWGLYSLAAAGGASQTVTFPLAFPSSCLAAWTGNNSGATNMVGTQSRTASSMLIVKGASDTAARTGIWFAIGK